MPNNTTKDKLFEKYFLTTLCQETLREWLIRIGFKYEYDVNKYYVGDHKNKGMILYRWEFNDCYLLLERCMFIWIHMTAEYS